MELGQEGQAAVSAIRDLPASQKQEAAKALAADPELFPKGDTGKTMIWMTLVIGLFVVVLAALSWSAKLALDDKDTSAFIAVATTAVGGLIGLFAKSPA